MKRAILALAFALFASSLRAGAADCIGMTTPVDPYDYEDITVSSTAIGFTAAKVQPTAAPTPASVVIFTVEDDAVRYRADGTAPTATVGVKAAINTEVTVCGTGAIRAFKAIRATTDATLRVTYYRSR